MKLEFGTGIIKEEVFGTVEVDLDASLNVLCINLVRNNGLLTVLHFSQLYLTKSIGIKFGQNVYIDNYLAKFISASSGV